MAKLTDEMKAAYAEAQAANQKLWELIKEQATADVVIETQEVVRDLMRDMSGVQWCDMATSIYETLEMFEEADEEEEE